MVYKSLIRPLMFLFDPENAHHISLGILSFLSKLPGGKSMLKVLFSPKNYKPISQFGLEFQNPVGLAAGFDKDGKYIEALATCGFGFIEVGTVTPLPQAGNDKPRLFRLPADKAVINRMGFNNEGVDALVERLKKIKKGNLIIGGNIGKNKITPNEKAVDDYLTCLMKLHDYVDYFVVNVSSPNTPGLRALQEKAPLMELLNTLQAYNIAQPKPKPLLLKIAPDLNTAQLDDIIDIVAQTKIQGLVATNTTVSREGLNTDVSKIKDMGMGGLSGKPVQLMSDEVLKYIHSKAPQIGLIGVGGIATSQDAARKMKAGAKLVQVYTGFIYEGPSIVRNMLVGL